MATRASALQRIRVSPWLGSFVAEIEIPSDGKVRVEQTGIDRNHFTIWADADDLLSWVVAVWGVDAVE